MEFRLNVYSWRGILIPISRWVIYKEIELERGYQDRTHGSLDERNPSIDEWLEILHTELEEVYEAKSNDHKLEELLQVVSVGVACLEQHGVIRRKELQ